MYFHTPFNNSSFKFASNVNQKTYKVGSQKWRNFFAAVLAAAAADMLDNKLANICFFLVDAATVIARFGNYYFKQLNLISCSDLMMLNLVKKNR